MGKPSAPVKGSAPRRNRRETPDFRVSRERKRKRRELRTVFWNGVLFKNPMLVGALGMFPLVACTTLKNALELSFLLLAISLPVNLILCFTGNLVPLWARPALAAGVSMVVYIPASLLTNWLFYGALQSLGMAAALMAVNSMILSRANEYAPAHIPSAVLADTLGCCLGGALVLCLAAILREWAAYGSIGMRSSMPYRGNGLDLPFFGFLLLGFLAAAVQHVNRRRAERAAGKKVNRL